MKQSKGVITMELTNMTLEEVVSALASLDEEVRSMNDVEEINKATEKKKELLERKAELETIETRKNNALALNEGTAKAETIIEVRKDETKMEKIELRDSLEYGKAFVKSIMTGDDTELRALLTDNVDGTIPVPTMLDTEIKNAWEEAKLISLVKQTNYAGNVKVGFEYSATGASIHVEGTDAPAEETLVLGTVELKAESIKKWITVSDEAIEGTTIDTLKYIYKEIAQKIAEKAEEVLIGKIVASPAASTTTACGVPVVAENPAVDTVVKAVSQLSAQAKNLYIAMNRQTYPAFVALALKAGYAIDVFDGLKDRIVYTDALKAFSAATAGDTYMIVGDFGYGAQANRPSGNAMKITVDDKSLAEKDLVKIVGKQYVGLGVVAPKAFTKVNKVNEG